MRDLKGLWAATAALAGAGLLAMGSAARADAIPYPNGGTYNATLYSFTAAADGDIVGYIVGGFSAGFENEVGLQVNGVLTGAGYGLNNHGSAEGDSFNFGAVQAGDLLTFVMHNISLDGYVYSDASQNAGYDDPLYVGGHNHVYSTPYTATSPFFAGVPAGTYLAFEDFPFEASSSFNYDNYDDESFVFTNTVAASAAPEPVSWALMILGFAGVGAMLRRRTLIPGT